MNRTAMPIPYAETAGKYDARTPLFAALSQARHGTLVLTLPDKAQVIFGGRDEGPLAEWSVYDWSVFDDFIARGEMGFADAYRAGKWDSGNLEALVSFGLLNAPALERYFHGHAVYVLWLRLKAFLLRSSPTGSHKNAMAHYNLGNEFYRLWLDEGMTYSCALFEGDRTRSLEEAQKAKYARILRAVGAKPGDHILEIGCGWGAFAEEAGRRGMRVTAITLAKEQAVYAQERIAKAGLEHLVSIKMMDYRDIHGLYDHIVSVGMFEHVGQEHWPAYFKRLHHCLRPGGKALVQSIMLDARMPDRSRARNGFIESYIFPGGQLPSQSQFKAHAQASQLDCAEMFRFGQDYALTLGHWLKRFEANLPKLRELGYDEPFIRLWRLYLASCIAVFKTGRAGVAQVLLTHAAAEAAMSAISWETLKEAA